MKPAERTATSALRDRGFLAFALHLWTVFGLALSNGFFGIAILLSLFRLRSWGALWSRYRSVFLPFSVYVTCILVSMAMSWDAKAIAGGAHELLALATLPMALLLVQGRRKVGLLVDGLLVVAALCAVFGLAQLLFFGYGGIDNRVPGPFSHYMTFAGFLLMADLLLIGELVCGGHRSVFRWVALGLINLALLATLTRSAWVAFVVALTLCLLLRRPRWVLAYLPAALLFAVLAPSTVVHRVVSIFDLQDVSNYDRICMVDAGLSMVRERPLVGLGPGMVRRVYPIYRHPSAPRRWVPHLHDNLVHIAAEEGLPTLAAYLWLTIGSLWLAYRGYRRSLREAGGASGLYLGGLLALAGFNLAGLFEYNWGDTEVQRVALFLIALPWCMQGSSDEA
ncbi:MAG: O-antigen ligase family protein [Thermoanaerobaculia bacterium]